MVKSMLALLLIGFISPLQVAARAQSKGETNMDEVRV